MTSISPASSFSNSNLVKSLAQKPGFAYCGISKVAFLEKEAPRLESWLKNGFHGKMTYMERNFDLRLDPSLLVPGAKSVISLVYNYFPPKTVYQKNTKYKISKYAYGKDYHKVLKKKMKLLWNEMEEAIGGEVQGRYFVDSAPVLEKAWAEKSGIGWIGKNANLIIPKAGSFYFLAELIVDLELKPDGPIKDFCGTCTRCIEACPTDAITPYQVDGSKCISYFTIELKENVPASLSKDFQDWVFGCDICQDVCPWNRHATPHQEPDFLPSEEFQNYTDQDWQSMTDEYFYKIFQSSALKRKKPSF
jgi:epoxyqueuosine reductase